VPAAEHTHDPNNPIQQVRNVATHALIMSAIRTPPEREEQAHFSAVLAAQDLFV
jgi:hypothetical protein